ncbi:MAG TPA: 4Fe-4S dicluster domain-containing protein [Planctomycetaceae bacterium]|nr:4Fe-4S dicluster domain-containing protein [Planctomycetaceae bacterium]
MAKVLAMLPAELADVAGDLQPDDELLTADELQSLSLFESLKKGPSFARFPGTTLLRRCPRGRVMCQQGEAGATAFYILTTDDVVRLREKQLAGLRETIAGRAAGRPEEDLHQYFGMLTDRELRSREFEIEKELEQWKRRSESLPAGEGSETAPERQVATAHLLVDLDANRPRRGLLHRFADAIRRGRGRRGPDRPDFIPVDGPADIDARTLRGPLHESELWGEMSCMNRAPRSATVIAEQDCYMLEMLRNVLDMLHSDPAYKQRMDQKYRQRVLQGHVRRLSVFQSLSDDEFERLVPSIELVDFESGATIFEEHEPSDCFYVIRSGLVKVLKNAWYFLRDAEFKDRHWKSLCEELTDAGGHESGLREKVWSALSSDSHAAVQEAAAAAAATLALPHRQTLLKELNHFIRQGDLHTSLGKTLKQVLEAAGADMGGQLRSTIADFPKETDRWSELERRTFHRALLEHLLPAGVPKRLESSGPRRTLAYLGRGDIMGEIGVLLEQPRSATCVAYDHPDSGYHQRIPDARTGAVPSRVELVRIDWQSFRQFLESSPRLREHVGRIVDERKRRIEREQADLGRLRGAIPQTKDFDQLGLIQGQRLMLIDLDRCTRCNACVEACVVAHEDGQTRLYLDGPRYEKYLVPLSCRQCLDPVCMIGCPVGSINRGETGEIVIRDWCIGCSLCADQCPYGSIQMNELRQNVELSGFEKSLLGAAEVKPVSERAVVCDMCSSLPSQQPSCVYACPHDAAMRVNAQEFFLQPVPLEARNN